MFLLIKKYKFVTDNSMPGWNVGFIWLVNWLIDFHVITHHKQQTRRQTNFVYLSGQAWYTYLQILWQ